MRARDTLQLVLSVFFIFYGVVSLLSLGPGEFLTGYFIYNGTQELTLVSPTPADGLIVNAKTTSINVSVSANVSHVNIEWGGSNQSMTQDGGYWHSTQNTTGNISYLVWANMSNNGTLLGQRRMVRRGYIVVANITGRDVLEDTNMTSIGLFGLVTSNTAKSALDYNLTFDNGRLNCAINQTYNLTCSPKANRTGRTVVTLKVTDGPVSDERSFTVNITKVNDPPHFTSDITEIKLPQHKNASFTPGDYVSDVDGDALTYTPINNSIVHAYMKENKVWIVPQATGYKNLSVNVSDGNATLLLQVPINVTPNHPPEVLSIVSSVNWSENNVGSVRMTQLFNDPDNDALTYNLTTPIAEIDHSISAQSMFFVPKVGFTGTRTVTITATDGQFTVQKPITLTIHPVGGAPSPSPKPAKGPASTVTPKAATFTPQTWAEDTSHTVDLTAFVDSNFNQSAAKVSVAGLTDMEYSVRGLEVTFRPAQDYFGDQGAQIVISDGATSYSGTMDLSVTNAPDDLKLKGALPNIRLDENNSQVEINLADYFADPDNANLDFDVEADGVNVSFKSKSVVVFSLAGPGSGNASARVIAKGSNGRTISSDMLVSLASAVKSDGQWYRLFLQGLIIALLTGVLALGGMKYQKAHVARKQRLKHINKTIETVYRDPEMVRSLQSQARQHPKAKKPEEKALTTVTNALSKLMNDLFYKAPQNTKPQMREPEGFRTELLYLKETISSLRAISTSVNDKLIAAALRAEKDKLMRAYHSVRGKPKLDRDGMRKLLLYVMESSSSLAEIAAVSDDALITLELRRQAKRMKKVMNAVMYKLEDHYDQSPLR